MTTKNVHSYFTDIAADSPLVGAACTKCKMCSAVLETTHGNTSSSLRHQNARAAGRVRVPEYPNLPEVFVQKPETARSINRRLCTRLQYKLNYVFH